MTAILDRIKSVCEKLNSYENFDQIQEKVSNLSDEEQHAFRILLETKKKLKSFIAERNDVDDDLMIRLEILGIYLMIPDDDRKKESKEQIKKIKEEHEYALETYRRVQKVPLLQKKLDVDSELLKKLLAKLYILENIKKSRIRDSTEIKIYLKMVVKILREKGWSKTQQRNFIYDLYYCFDYENCIEMDPKSYKKKLWMMIHRL